MTRITHTITLSLLLFANHRFSKNFLAFSGVFPKSTDPPQPVYEKAIVTDFRFDI